MKFREYQQNQIMLIPPDINEMIPSNHVVRGIDAVVEQLNLTRLYNSYSEEGQPGYHPKMLLKILLYGYSTGVMSSRKIAARVESDLYYMYLSGMQRPDFRTISDFRKNKREYLAEYFHQILELCKAMGLLRLGHIAIDGSKIEASASKKSIMEKEKLREAEKRTKEKIESLIREAEKTDAEENGLYGEDKRGDELPEELSGENKLLTKLQEAKRQLEEQELSRVSITDPSARRMRTSDGGIEVCYNAQISVDSEYQVIAANDVVSDVNDTKQFIPIYEKTVLNLKNNPDKVSADAGYQSGAVYLYLESKGIDGYIPDSRFKKETGGGKEEKFDKYDRRQFKFNEATNQYICPEGQTLSFRKNNKRNGVSFKEYRGDNCENCGARKACLLNTKFKARQIQIYENDKFKTEMRKKLVSEEGKKIYERRIAIVEPVFANIKRILGFRQFLLRGIEKVKFEFNLVCTAYNLKKLIKYGKVIPA